MEKNFYVLQRVPGGYLAADERNGNFIINYQVPMYSKHCYYDASHVSNVLEAFLYQHLKTSKYGGWYTLPDRSYFERDMADFMPQEIPFPEQPETENNTAEEGEEA